MMQKTENTQVSLLLDVLVQETRKHRELLKHLSRIFEHNQSVSGGECKEQMGALYAEAVKTVHSIRDKVLRGLPITQALRTLAVFEKGAFEEYVTEIHAKVRSFAQDDEVVKQILENIAEDEKGHVELLKHINEIASERQIA
jgi:hypothetical protein